MFSLCRAGEGNANFTPRRPQVQLWDWDSAAAFLLTEVGGGGSSHCHPTDGLSRKEHQMLPLLLPCFTSTSSGVLYPIPSVTANTGTGRVSHCHPPCLLWWASASWSWGKRAAFISRLWLTGIVTTSDRSEEGRMTNWLRVLQKWQLHHQKLIFSVFFFFFSFANMHVKSFIVQVQA